MFPLPHGNRSGHGVTTVIAFLFPGQGSQKVGMGQALADAFPICRDTFAEADDALGILRLARYAARAPVALKRLHYDY